MLRPALLSAALLFSPLQNASAHADTFVDHFDEAGYTEPSFDIPSDSTSLNDSSLPQRPVVGTKKVLLVVGHWSGTNGLDPAMLWKQSLSDDPDSLRSYVLAASKGKLVLDGKMITADFGTRACDKAYPLAGAAAQAQGIELSDYEYLFVAIDCGGGANAVLGGKRMLVKGMPGSSHVWKHEFGHNLGAGHPSTYTNCPYDGKEIRAPETCAKAAYGDSGDPVGGGSGLYPAHYRWFAGWLEPSQVAVVKQTGIYRLGTLGGAAHRKQLLLIDRPSSEPRQLALEYRQPGEFFDKFTWDDNRVNGVWIRYVTMTNMASVQHTQLDGTPNTKSTQDPTLLPGQILSDEPSRTQIKVCSTHESGALVSVALHGEPLRSCDGP